MFGVESLEATRLSSIVLLQLPSEFGSEPPLELDSTTRSSTLRAREAWERKVVEVAVFKL